MGKRNEKRAAVCKEERSENKTQLPKAGAKKNGVAL